MLVSRLAVAWPLISTLVRSSGGECIALKGSAAAAGLLLLPLAPALPRADEGALWVVAVAVEERADWLATALAVGTCTMAREADLDGAERRGRWDSRGLKRVQQVVRGGRGLGGRHRMGGERKEVESNRVNETRTVGVEETRSGEVVLAKKRETGRRCILWHSRRKEEEEGEGKEKRRCSGECWW